jgi:hypothetical protein
MQSPWFAANPTAAAGTPRATCSTRPKPQGFKRLVVELAAVVLPHSSIVSAYGT